MCNGAGSVGSFIGHVGYIGMLEDLSCSQKSNNLRRSSDKSMVDGGYSDRYDRSLCCDFVFD